jgi:hypothetical protein
MAYGLGEKLRLGCRSSAARVGRSGEQKHWRSNVGSCMGGCTYACTARDRDRAEEKLAWLECKVYRGNAIAQAGCCKVIKTLSSGAVDTLTLRQVVRHPEQGWKAWFETFLKWSKSIPHPGLSESTVDVRLNMLPQRHTKLLALLLLQ